MTSLMDKSPKERASLLQDWQKQYELVSGNLLSMDLSRGKPAADQLALSDALESAIDGDYRAKDGTDVRNYGGLRGLPEARALGAEQRLPRQLLGGLRSVGLGRVLRRRQRLLALGLPPGERGLHRLESLGGLGGVARHERVEPSERYVGSHQLDSLVVHEVFLVL